MAIISIKDNVRIKCSFRLLSQSAQRDGSDLRVGGDICLGLFLVGDEENSGGDESECAILNDHGGEVVELYGVLVPIGVVEEEQGVEDDKEELD